VKIITIIVASILIFTQNLIGSSDSHSTDSQNYFLSDEWLTEAFDYLVKYAAEEHLDSGVSPYDLASPQ